VTLGNQQNVTRKERACVEEPDRDVVLENDMGRGVLICDLAEYTVVRHRISDTE
jgi:hypothetical protein